MLRIRRKQLDALGARSAADFVARTTPLIVAWKLPGLDGLPAPEIEAWMRERMGRAEELGLDDEATLLAWLEVAGTWGDDFAEDAFVVHLLGEPGTLDDWGGSWATLEAIAAATLYPTAEPSDDAT